MNKAWLLAPVIALFVWHGPGRLVRHLLADRQPSSPAPIVVEVDSREQVIERSQVLRKGAICELQNISGSIVVRRADSDTARLRAVFSGRTRVEVSSDSNGLRAQVVHANRANDDGGDVEYYLDLPAGAGLRVRTVSGDTDVVEIDGPLDLRAVSGEVRVGPARGEIGVETVSGDVTLSDAAGTLRVRTISGDVDVALPARPAGGALSTVSGEIVASAPSGAPLSVTARTASGEIENSFSNGGGAPLSVGTMSGDIRISKR